jgi:hypothetical protein
MLGIAKKIFRGELGEEIGEEKGETQEKVRQRK